MLGMLLYKKTLEDNIMAFDFKIETTKAQPTMVVRTVTNQAGIVGVLTKAFSEIPAYLAEKNVEILDAPFAAYYNMDFEKLEMEGGFVISSSVDENDDFVVGEISGGDKATCMYKGSYSSISEAYDELAKWIKKQSRKAVGHCYEFYYNSPMEVEESELLTKIVMPLV